MLIDCQKMFQHDFEENQTPTKITNTWSRLGFFFSLNIYIFLTCFFYLFGVFKCSILKLSVTNVSSRLSSTSCDQKT